MKKTIFALCSFLLLFGTVNAQQPRTINKPTGHPSKGTHQRLSVEERAKNRTEKYNTVCGLSADQYSSILQINTTFFTKKDQVVKSEKSKEEIHVLAKERNVQEHKVLTKEQLAKWRAQQQQQQKGQPQKGTKGNATTPKEAEQED